MFIKLSLQEFILFAQLLCILCHETILDPESGKLVVSHVAKIYVDLKS